jgi:hypothetical protein
MSVRRGSSGSGSALLLAGALPRESSTSVPAENIGAHPLDVSMNEKLLVLMAIC